MFGFYRKQSKYFLSTLWLPWMKKTSANIKFIVRSKFVETNVNKSDYIPHLRLIYNMRWYDFKYETIMKDRYFYNNLTTVRMLIVIFLPEYG